MKDLILSPKVKSSRADRLRRCALRIIFLLLLSQPGWGQYRFDSFTTDNGLPQNGVRGIAQTSDGYLWFTTFDGLVRFDGAKFTVFDKNNTPGILSNRFSMLHVEKDGALFAGTEDGGLTVYRNGVFKTYTVSDGLPSDTIIFFRTDAKGNFVIQTAAGNCYFRDGKILPVPESEIPNNNLFYHAPSGNLWFYDKNSIRQITPDKREIDYPVKLDYYNDKFTAITLFEDSLGNLWLGDLSAVYRLKDGVIDRFTTEDGMPPRTILRPFVEEADGSIWFTSGWFNSAEATGIVRFYQGRFSTWGEAVGLSSSSTGQIFKDSEGTIWAASDRGLNHLQKQFIKSFSVPDGLIYSEVYPLLQTRNGDVYIGTTRGLSRFRDGKFSDVVARNKKGDYISATSLFEDGRERLWIGSGGGDLFRLENGELSRFEIGDNAIVQAIEDDRSGNVWLGTNKGLLKFKDDRIIGKYTIADGLLFDDIKAIYKDKNGVLWIGTYDGGLSRFRDGKFFNFTVENGLFSNGVFQILEDERGNFWMSSNRGISRVKRQELEDFAAGKIKQINSLSYGKQDGMLNTECNGGRQPAGFKTSDGKFWFPTQDGVVVVNPEEVPFNPNPPPVQIESVLIERQVTNFQNGISLKANDDNLEIRFTGISFIKPDQVKFRYRIEGLDEDWSDVESDSSLKVVAEVDNGEDALLRIEELEPDVAVLDVNMPHADGLTVAKTVQEKNCRPSRFF